MSTRIIHRNREFPLDPEVWEALADAALTFETPNDVLRRLLLEGGASTNGATETPRRSDRPRRMDQTSRSRRKREAERRRAPSDALLPESEYELPILTALEKAGGRLPASEAVAAVGEALADRLTDTDREPLAKGGRIRWQNRTQFVRLHLVRQGDLKADSPRGLWEISDAGRARLAKETA